MHVVVVGAGHAGVQVADSLRAEGYDGRVTLIGAEPHVPYQRPPLTKELLADTGAEVLPLRAERFYEEAAIDLVRGDPVHQIDRSAMRVVLSGGRTVSYTHLVLATGAQNRTIEGLGHLAGVHNVRGLDDARALGHALEAGQRLVIIGAGFLGLEVAAIAVQRGLHVVVLSPSAPLSRSVSRPMSAFLREAHVADGVTFVEDSFASATSRRDDGVDRVTGVIGGSGRRYEADAVLVAIGAAPNTHLAAAAGLSVEGGVLVDRCLRTSDPQIWAIGDCAHRHGGDGSPGRLESVQAATDNAKSLARTLTGRPTSTLEHPWFWSIQGAMRLQIAGVAVGSDEAVVMGDPATRRFSVLRFRGARLTAVESINRPADHLAARRIFASGAALSPSQAGAPDFDLKEFAQRESATV